MPDAKAWATLVLREVKGSMTSMAELVQALAGVVLPLAESQLGLPLLLTAATDEINTANFDLMQSLVGAPQPSAKRRAGGSARNSPQVPKKKSRVRRGPPSPVVEADAALAEGLPEFVSELLGAALAELLSRCGAADVLGRAELLRSESRKVAAVMSSEMTLQSTTIEKLEKEKALRAPDAERKELQRFNAVIEHTFAPIADGTACARSYDANALKAELTREAPRALRLWHTVVTSQRGSPDGWFRKLQKGLVLIAGLARVARTGGEVAALEMAARCLLWGAPSGLRVALAQHRSARRLRPSTRQPSSTFTSVATCGDVPTPRSSPAAPSASGRRRWCVRTMTITWHDATFACCGRCHRESSRWPSCSSFGSTPSL